MKRVRIFVDHQNLTIAWEKNSSTGTHKLAWERLPELIMQRLEGTRLTPDGADLRGVSVYASVVPAKSGGMSEEERFLRYELDQLPGYSVKVSFRQKRECHHSPGVVHWVEKGVDVKLACDLMALAMRDLYDVAVIISGDQDLIPSIEGVQDILDKQVVHVGFRERDKEVRSASWANIVLDDIQEGLRGAPRPADELEKQAEKAAENGGAKKRSRRPPPWIRKKLKESPPETAIKQAIDAAREKPA